MNHYVYKITNNINGRKYIGKRSCNCLIEKDYYFGSGIAIKEALRKYGVDNFSKKIIKTFDSSKEAFEYEEYLISKLDCIDNIEYYNISRGGLGGVGTLAGKTELEKWEIYNRIKNTLKGKMAGSKNPMYGRTGENNPNYKRYVPIETRNKISEALKGKPFTESHKENIRKGRIGMKLSDEHRKNIGLGGRGRKMSDKCKEALRASNAKPIIMLNNLELFNFIVDGSFKYGVAHQDIGKVCRGKRNSAGKLNGEPIKWVYLEDYNYCIENSVDIDLYKKQKYNK